MRTVWFALVGPSISDVEAQLRTNGFVQGPGDREFRIPSLDEPVLYVACDAYEWVEPLGLQDEYDELLHALSGRQPTVQVTADVSGRVPGDVEVLRLAEALLGAFDGHAFDDWHAYRHAWTLDEMRRGFEVDGLRFFDCARWGRTPPDA